MAEKKYSAFALLDIITEYTDEEHILTTKQLQQLLLEKYGLDLERRTLYSNFDILEQSGLQISRYEENGKGYFLKTKQFEKGEILLLCNAIHASHFISAQKSEELIAKLLKTLSKYQAQEFRNNVYLPNPQKTKGSELIQNISLVSKAIQNRKEIQFTYLKYDKNKNMVPRRSEPYVVEPRYIVYADSRAYMIASNKKYENFIHFRLDRMSEIRITDVGARIFSNDKDAYEYAKNKLFMYAGETEPVLFLCHERIMDQIIDIFGTEIMIIPKDDSTFAIRVNTSRTGAKYLAQQFMDSLEILEPESLRNEFCHDLMEVLIRYQN